VVRDLSPRPAQAAVDRPGEPQVGEVRRGRAPERLDGQPGGQDERERERGPAALPRVDQDEEGQEAQRRDAVADLRVQHHQREQPGAQRVDAILPRARVLRRQIHDEQRRESRPADPVVEARERQGRDGLAEVDRRRQDEQQEGRERQRDDRPQPGGEDVGHRRGERQDEQRRPGRQRGAETAREPVARGGDEVGDRSEDGVEVPARDLTRGDPVGAVEDHEKVLDVFRCDGLAGQRQEERAHGRHREHRDGHGPRPPFQGAAAGGPVEDAALGAAAGRLARHGRHRGSLPHGSTVTVAGA
jgi:hypothetical protein